MFLQSKSNLSVRTLLLTALFATVGAVGLVGASMADSSQAGETIGRQLHETEILDLLSGTVMFGKYLDGRPDWKEQTSANGELLDADNDYQKVGSWNVIGSMVCYSYWYPSGTHCFDVYEADQTYYFYSPGTTDLIAYSYKVERRPMM